MADEGTMALEVSGLSKGFGEGASRITVLDGVNVALQRGAFEAVMGPSGSGKSTLMNLIGCLDRPTGGRYWLDGEEVGALTKSELSRVRNQRLGFVFQGFNLLARTSALENVELPLLYSPHGHRARELRRRSREALERVGLADRAGHQPSQLSGGQQQRVAIARALVNEPALLLADEPTGNLDSENGRRVMQLLGGLNRSLRLTVLLATHSDEAASHAASWLVLRDGRLVAQGDNPQSEKSP